MSRPNLFIVGAPKSGTTALSEYLAAHPDVFMCVPKEPHYFATDMPKKRFVQDESAYLRLFADAGARQARGEASVWYLYSESALENIKAFDPGARLIVMVRNPVDLVYSMHSQHVYSLNEDEKDFARAWSLNAERKQGRHIPRYCKAPQLLYYDEIAKLGEQLDRAFAVFPRAQVHVVFFEDFVRDTRAAYLDIMAFLGLEDDGREDFPVINENKRNKSRLVAVATRKPPRLVNKLAVDAKRLLGLTGKFRIRKLLKAFNARAETRARLPEAVRREMIQAYRDDVVKLGRITGRDLSAWLS